MKVALVSMKVRGEMVDAIRQECHLNLRRTRIRLMLSQCVHGRRCLLVDAHLSLSQYTLQFSDRQALPGRFYEEKNKDFTHFRALRYLRITIKQSAEG